MIASWIRRSEREDGSIEATMEPASQPSRSETKVNRSETALLGL